MDMWGGRGTHENTQPSSFPEYCSYASQAVDCIFFPVFPYLKVLLSVVKKKIILLRLSKLVFTGVYETVPQ